MSTYGLSPSPNSLLSLGCTESAASVSIEEEVMELFTEMHNPIFRHLLWLNLQADQAEDVVQETFLRLYQHLSRPNASRQNLRGWVWRVAHNFGLNLCMSASRRSSRKELNLEDISTWLADPRPDPEQVLLQTQDDLRISAGIESLNERDRLCMALRADGMGYREIASVLGIGRSTVADTLVRVASFLRSYSH